MHTKQTGNGSRNAISSEGVNPMVGSVSCSGVKSPHPKLPSTLLAKRRDNLR